MGIHVAIRALLNYRLVMMPAYNPSIQASLFKPLHLHPHSPSIQSASIGGPIDSPILRRDENTAIVFMDHGLEFEPNRTAIR